MRRRGPNLSPVTPIGLGTHYTEDTDLAQPMSIPTIRVSAESNQAARGKKDEQEAVSVRRSFEHAVTAENVGVKEDEPAKVSTIKRGGYRDPFKLQLAKRKEDQLRSMLHLVRQ